MSRGLIGTKCYFCDYPHMTLLEPPRFRSKAEHGAHYKPYEYVKFADAECPACGAEYLAWCDGITVSEPTHHMYDRDNGLSRVRRSSKGYSDLSFRSAFGDEPCERDMPKRKPRQAWVDEDGKIICELPKEDE